MNQHAIFDPALPQRYRVHLKVQQPGEGAPGLRALVFGLLAFSLLAISSSGFSQVPKPSAPGSASVSAKHVASRPSWNELSPAQQQALAPLAASWNTGMSEAQKRKWLEISKNYSALSPAGQATLKSRMNDWVALSPQQRAQARLNFGKTKELSRQLTAEEKKAQWEAYQSLSPEEKQKLAAKSLKPTGAATAIKPVSPQKLAILPTQAASKPGLKPASKIMPSRPATVPMPAVAPAGQATPVDTGTAPLR